MGQPISALRLSDASNCSPRSPRGENRLPYLREGCAKNATEPEEDEACEAKAAAAAGDQSGALQNLKTTRTRTDVSKLGTSQVEAHLSSRIASGTSGTGERNSPG